MNNQIDNPQLRKLHIIKWIVMPRCQFLKTSNHADYGYLIGVKT